jgi:hypothetical protein
MPPRDRMALAAMERAWHETQRQALEDALQTIRYDDEISTTLGQRGDELLLVLSHAAALDELPSGTIAAWIHAQDLRPALAILTRSGRLGPRARALWQIPQPAHTAMWATARSLLGARR